MLTLSERITYALDELTPKISQAKLARAVGVSPPSVNDWKSGKTKEIEHDNAVKAAICLGVPYEWLRHGKGAKPDKRSSQDRTQTQYLTPIEPWDSKTPLEDDEIEIPFYKDFKFACGKGKFGDTEIKETRRLRISKLTLRNRNIEFINASAATATDNSMAPTINEGSTILIDCGRKKIKDGQIFIIQHGDGEYADFRCKRLYNLPLGGVRIVSDNVEEYPEERLTAQEIKEQHFIVLGWVFSVQQLFTW